MPIMTDHWTRAPALTPHGELAQDDSRADVHFRPGQGQRLAAYRATLYDGLSIGGAYRSQFMTELASWWAFCRSVWAIMR